MQQRKLIESRQFTQRFAELEASGDIPENFWEQLEHTILNNPSSGQVIEGVSGLRWVAMLVGGRMQGNKQIQPQRVRVFLLDLPKRKHTHLLAIFGKSEHTGLTDMGRERIKELVTEIKKGAQ